MNEWLQGNYVPSHVRFVHHCCFVSVQKQPKVFSAGLDILEMYQKNPEHYATFWKAVQEMWLRLYSSSLVTVAAINVRDYQFHTGRDSRRVTRM